MSHMMESLENRILLADYVGEPWGMYVGTSLDDNPLDIAADHDGNMWIASGTYSAEDAINLHKVSPSGVTLFTASIPWLHYGSAAIAIDQANNLWVVGNTDRGDLVPSAITSPVNFPTVPGGGTRDDVVVAKLSENGALLWTTFIASSHHDYGAAIAFDPSGNALIVGNIVAADLRGVNNQYHGGSDDGFIAKLDPSGKQLWATYLGGSDLDRAKELAVDSAGNAYVIGTTRSKDFAGALNSRSSEREDGFMTRVSPDGLAQWSVYSAGILAVTLTNDGNLMTQSLARSVSTISYYHPDGALLGATPYPWMVSYPDGEGGMFALENMASTLEQTTYRVMRINQYGVVEAQFRMLQWDYAFKVAPGPRGEVLILSSARSQLYPSITPFHGGDGDAFVSSVILPPVGSATRRIVGTPGSDRIYAQLAEVIDPATGITHAGMQFILNGTVTAPFVPEHDVVIYGGFGDDEITIHPSVGYRFGIYGDAGSDTLRGGAGNDVIYGGAGIDVIYGGGGNDTIFGEFGGDYLFGEDGDDELRGMAGRDYLDGGIGDDRLVGGDGSDTLSGDAGDDYLEGRGKADTLNGGFGNDSLFGGAGADLMRGHAGDDWLDPGVHLLFADTLQGGAGYDRYKADENDSVLEVEELLA